MSVRLTLPLKRALTGPIFTLTAACSSVSESFSRLSQPGMDAFNVSASLRRAHTVARSAGSTNSPDIVTAMAHLSLRVCFARGFVAPKWPLGKLATLACDRSASPGGFSGTEPPGERVLQGIIDGKLALTPERRRCR